MSAVTQIRGKYLTELVPGDERDRAFQNLRGKLETVATATGAHLFVFDPRYTSPGDTAPGVPIGTRYARAEFDRAEIDRVFDLGRTASSMTFVGGDHKIYKTGYAPVRASETERQIVLALRAEAPVSYLSRLADLHDHLFAWGVGLLAFSVVAASLATLLIPFRTRGAPEAQQDAPPPERDPPWASSVRTAPNRHVILFLAANPSGTTRLDLDDECAAIERELSMSPARHRFDFHSKRAVSVDEMMRRLNGLQPSVIHVSSHGGPDRGSSPDPRAGARRDIEPAAGGTIYLEDERQQRRQVDERALAQMIASAAPHARAVVLNACYSDALADALCGVVDGVVGMRGAISDGAVLVFAVAFYRALGHRCSVGNAVDQARATLAAMQLPGEHLPVLRTRSGLDAGQLFLV